LKKLKLKYSIPCKFRYLTPLTGEASPYPFSRTPDIVKRARALLRDKSHEEILDIWRTTNGVIRKNAKKLRVLDFDPVLLLNQSVEKESRTLKHPYARHRVCEYFAVLALSLVDDAMHTLDVTKRIFLPNMQKSEMLDKADRNAMAANKVIFAMDAISVAEKLDEDDVRFSNLGKKGASVKHAKTNALRAWTLQLYREKKWPSPNKAAHALKNEVMLHGRTIGAYLTEENAQRTIADWIRKDG